MKKVFKWAIKIFKWVMIWFGLIILAGTLKRYYGVPVSVTEGVVVFVLIARWARRRREREEKARTEAAKPEALSEDGAGEA